MFVVRTFQYSETVLTILAFQPPIHHHDEATQRTGARSFDQLPSVIRR